MSDTIQVFAIPAYHDNYIWCAHNATHAVVVDPGDASPVLGYLQAHGLSLSAIIVTHHHWDHTDGIDDLLAAYPNSPVFGPHNPKIHQITHMLRESDQISLPGLELELEVMEVPGHTLDHIAYFNQALLFCGDTLFSAGCGRLFEGKPAQMQASLSKLMALPANTQIYCTHEYTLANLKFAQTIEPDNADLATYSTWAKQQRAQSKPTLPSSIAQQANINPFVRLGSEQVVDSLIKQGYRELNTPAQKFAALRHWKDNF